MLLGDTYYVQGSQNKYTYARMHARKVAKKLNWINSCENCGFDRVVQVCHIKPIASFPPETPLNIVNHRDNIKILCPNCHWLFDHGEL